METLMEWPRALIERAIATLEEETHTARKVALLCVDTAVEQMTKVHALRSGMPRRDAREGFKHILTYLEGHGAASRALDLRGMQLYHQMRNQLYHMGPDESPEPLLVARYAALALALLCCLTETKAADRLDAVVVPFLDSPAGTKDQTQWSRDELAEFYESSNPLGKALLLVIAGHGEGLALAEVEARMLETLAILDPEWNYDFISPTVLRGVVVGFARRADGRRKRPIVEERGSTLAPASQVAEHMAAIAAGKGFHSAPPPLPEDDFGAPAE